MRNERQTHFRYPFLIPRYSVTRFSDAAFRLAVLIDAARMAHSSSHSTISDSSRFGGIIAER